MDINRQNQLLDQNSKLRHTNDELLFACEMMFEWLMNMRDSGDERLKDDLINHMPNGKGGLLNMRNIIEKARYEGGL